jgi:hypothetical protein
MPHDLPLDRKLLAGVHASVADIRDTIRLTRAAIEQSRALLRTFEIPEERSGRRDGHIAGRSVARASVFSGEPDSRRWIKADSPNANNRNMEWKPITTAPFDRDIGLAVIDHCGTHTLVFPSRRLLRGWIKAETKRSR